MEDDLPGAWEKRGVVDETIDPRWPTQIDRLCVPITLKAST